MSPAHKIFVFAPPGGALVLRVTDDSGGAKFTYREVLHRPRLGRNEDNLALNIFPRVLAFGGPAAHVDQISGHVGALTVFRESDRHSVIASHEDGRLPGIAGLLHLPELGDVGVPGLARALGAIENLAVGGKFEDLHIAQAIGPCPLRDQFGRRMKSTRSALAMIAHDAFEIALRGFTGEFLCQHGDIFFRKQRRLLRGSSGEQTRQ